MEIRDLSGKVLYRSSTLHDMALGGPLRLGEGDTGFDERVIKLQDGSHAFIVSHIHTMKGRTLVVRLSYDLGPLRERMYQFLLLLSIAIPLACPRSSRRSSDRYARSSPPGTDDRPCRAHHGYKSWRQAGSH